MSPCLWVAGLAAVCVSTGAFAQDCPTISPGFPANGASHSVETIAVFDEDGPGTANPKMFIGGGFSHFGVDGLPNLVRWDGPHVEQVGGVVNGAVLAMAVFDADGAGPGKASLYAGGKFTSAAGVAAAGVARWDGQAWHALPALPTLPPGGSGPWCTMLKVVDPDLSGPLPQRLYASVEKNFGSGGSFGKLVYWDGAVWTVAAEGLVIADVTPFDPDGAVGPAPAKLYAVGLGGFRRQDGAAWTLVTPTNTSGHVFHRLTAFDPDGGGPQPVRLYMAGSFNSVGAILANNIAKWDGSTWSWVGTPPGGVTGGAISALRVLDIDGPGPAKQALVAAGNFTAAGGVPAKNLATWDGSAWKTIPGGLMNSFTSQQSPGNAGVITTFDVDGNGPARTALYVGGSFNSAGPVATTHIASFDPILSVQGGGSEGWSSVGAGIGGDVLTFALYNDGSGQAVYAGGRFVNIGGRPFNNIARWNGGAHKWEPLGSGLTGGSLSAPGVEAMTVRKDEFFSTLYVGGDFTSAGGGIMKRIARYNQNGWRSVGTGMNGAVKALQTVKEGPIEIVYAGGSFTTAGSAAALNVARWDGQTWSAVGAGFDGPVYALRAFDDGGGVKLYAGGKFTKSGSTTTIGVAQWTGTGWAPMGQFVIGSVNCFGVYDAGQGPRLYAGGNFVFANGLGERFIAKWENGTWKGVGADPYNRPNAPVLALRAFDDGDGGGPALYAGGSFNTVFFPNPNKHRYLARLRNDVWTNVTGPGLYPDRPVYALGIPLPQADGSFSMFVGGGFNVIGNTIAGRAVMLKGCPVE